MLPQVLAITFTGFKPALLFNPTREIAGQIELINPGFPSALIEQIGEIAEFTTLNPLASSTARTPEVSEAAFRPVSLLLIFDIGDIVRVESWILDSILGPSPIGGF